MRYSNLLGVIAILLCGVGFAISSGSLYYEHFVKNSEVPDGVFQPILLAPGASYQLTIVKDSDSSGSIVVWVREDRNEWFESESLLPAKTTISKIILDCEEQNLVINEQRIFGTNMTHLKTVENMRFIGNSSSAVSVVTLMAVCNGPKEINQPSPKSIKIL